MDMLYRLINYRIIIIIIIIIIINVLFFNFSHMLHSVL